MVVLSGKTLISVDIQEEYAHAFPFDIRDFGKFINTNWKKFGEIIFLYNGESLGFHGESEYTIWLLENAGIKESVLDNIHFFDKGYAFFREFMDTIDNDDDMLVILKYMVVNDINDSRDIDDDQIEELRKMDLSEDSIQFLEARVEMVNIPDVFEYLQRKQNILLCGGGQTECLREVEILLMLHGSDYQLLDQFVY